MKTASRSLLTSPLRNLALAFLFANSAPLASAHTTIWEGDSSFRWSDPANWSNGLPTTTSDVFIGSPTLDVDVIIGSLTFQAGGFGDALYDDGPKNLIVQGTTTFEDFSDPLNSVILIKTGSNFRLGTTNFPAGKLFGYFYIEDGDGTATTTPTVVQFRDADVRENRAEVYLYGPDAAILDQNTGQHAFRNFTTNNGSFNFGYGAVLSTTGNLTNNLDLYISKYSAGPATRFTVDGTLINSLDGIFSILGGVEMTVTGDVNNSGGGENGIFIIESHLGVGDTIFNVNGNLTNAGGADMTVYGGDDGQLARLTVDGDMNNAGSVHLIGGEGSLEVGGTLSMTNGEIIREWGGNDSIFRITAEQINLAAGTLFDVTRGIIFADVVAHGILTTDTFSGGDVTFNGSLTLTDTAQLDVQLAGTTPGQGYFRYDQISHVTPAGGTVGTVLDGVLQVSLIHDFHQTITSQNTFSILVSDRMLSGAFNNVASGGRLQTIEGDGTFLVTYAGQNSVVLSQFQVIPLAPASVVSRKSHGMAGNFDIVLTETPGIECRSGGANNDYELIVSFPRIVTFTSSAVTSGTGAVSSTGGSGTPQLSINLTGVTNVQRITVTLYGVSDDTRTNNVALQMGVLVGDNTANGIVSNTDVSVAKAQVSSTVTAANFRTDVNANGIVSNTDVSVTKAQVSTSLP